MRDRRPRVVVAGDRALLCVVVVFASGCTAIDDTMVQALEWVWLIVSFLFAALICGALRWWAWREALTSWTLETELKPTTTGWTPVLAVGAVLIWFVVYNFISEFIPPEQQWLNAGAWLLGSAGGTVAGWFGGRHAAQLEFRKEHPGQALTGPGNENS